MAENVTGLGVRFNSSMDNATALANHETEEGKGTIHFTTEGDIVLNGTNFTRGNSANASEIKLSPNYAKPSSGSTSFTANSTTIESAIGSLAKAVDGKQASLSFMTAPTSTNKVATKSDIDAAVAGASNYLGTVTAVTGLSTTAKKGDFYRVATAWSGVHVGDILIAEQNNPAAAVITSGTNGYTCLHNETNTDERVTSAANHYAPDEDSTAQLSASASGATAAWSIDVVKGVTIKRDAKGHVTGVSVTSGKIPANPNTNYYVNSAVFAYDNNNHNVKMTLTRTDNGTVTANIPVMTACTDANQGTGKAGLVPDSAVGEQNKVLSAGGSWVHQTRIMDLALVAAPLPVETGSLAATTAITSTGFKKTGANTGEVIVSSGSGINAKLYRSWAGRDTNGLSMADYQQPGMVIICNGDFYKWDSEKNCFSLVALTSPVPNLIWD